MPFPRFAIDNGNYVIHRIFLIILTTLHCLSLLEARRGARGAGGALRPQNVGKCDKDTPVLRANTSIQFLTCSVRVSQRSPAPGPTSPMHSAHSWTITPTYKVTHNACWYLSRSRCSLPAVMRVSSKFDLNSTTGTNPRISASFIECRSKRFAIHSHVKTIWILWRPTSC